MGQTRQQIQLNYQRTLQQAEELEGLAEQIDSMADKEIDWMMRNLSSAWRGEEGSRYCQKGNRLNLMIKQHGKDLKNVAALLRRSADRTYQAELLSIEIAEKRGY